jgi:hypothetical protein
MNFIVEQAGKPVLDAVRFNGNIAPFSIICLGTGFPACSTKA